ncbi:MAG: nitroreductase family protein [Clostridia bacterium]|nr:nitroreductase family protein [Clostridia bacterium]
MNAFLDLANDRYSVRKFEGGEVPQADVDKVIEAGICAPMAVNCQPFKIWVIKSAEAKEKLLSCTKMQFIAPADVIFMIGSKADEAWVRPFDNKNSADVDASIVTTQMMLEIHDLGYGSTWIGHFDVNKVKDLFPETKAYDLIALLPMGRIAADCEPSPRHKEYRSRDELVKVL